MDDFEWTVLNESKLLEAMVCHKPIGINKNFEMVCILDKLYDQHVEISGSKIWEHLSEMYNLEALNLMDLLRLPNDEREFYLPELEFGSLKVKKEDKLDDKANKQIMIKRNDIKEVPKAVVKEIKKEDKSSKKDGQRRDSKDGKDIKLNTNIKKEIKKDNDKFKSIKGRNSTTVREEEKNRIPKYDETNKRPNKRPTRGSMKPEENNSGKSQSPLTVPSTSSSKRRRI